MRFGDVQQFLHRVPCKMTLVIDLQGVIPRNNVVEICGTLWTVKRDLGVKIDSCVKMLVLPLFQRLSAHAVLIMHIHKFGLRSRPSSL